MNKDDQQRINNIKKQILVASHETGEGHIPSAFSILDVLYVLYHDVMDVDPDDPWKADRDYCIVSKGHAALGLYGILADMGYFETEELKTTGQYQSRLGGHPDYNKVPGIEASTGSLGHGMPMAVGLALGLRIKGSGQRVFCVLGDGEANEGSVWEAVAVAGERKINNLVCIVDYNHSIERSISWGNVEDKFECFRWDTVIVDGHDHEQLRKALTRDHKEKPLAVIANTVKGKGCKAMESDPFAWHHRSPDKDELKQFLEELDS